MKKGLVRMRRLAWCVAFLAATSFAWAAHPDTNPMNYDSQVREAYERFYNLDFPAAIDRFERFHGEHPGDPQATAYLLEAVLFRELYEQDLLDTTFYANDGFLTGRHATRENPQARDRMRFSHAAGSAVSSAPTWPWCKGTSVAGSSWPQRPGKTKSTHCSWTRTTSTPSSWWVSISTW